MARTCGTRYERAARQRGWRLVAGVDEVGRGALIGPVFAAAVILDPRRRIVGLDDSKKLRARRRRELAERIRERAISFAVASVEAARIDAWNIYQASRQAMRAAVTQLAPQPDYILVDALLLDDLAQEQRKIIQGDAKSVSIAAASILAKVARDELMAAWEERYPGYGLARNKGYATREHLEGLRRLGPTPDHRRSFAPVRACLVSPWPREQRPFDFETDTLRPDSLNCPD